MINWKTNASGITIIVVYVLSYFFPQHKGFFDGLIPLLAAAGFIVAKDYNVSGGAK
jgi:hypothetical protein